MDDESEQGEASLDDLSRAFAAALDRNRDGAPPDQDDASQVDSDTSDDVAAAGDTVVEADADDDSEVSDDACEISPKSIFEAILFVGHPENRPITSKAVAALLRGVDEAEIDDAAAELNQDYVRQGWPFQVAAADGGYRLQLSDGFEAIRERFYGRIRQSRLSRQAVDVLAIVAYNQPVERSKVDELLGTNCSRVLNQLLRRELLAKQLVSEKPKSYAFVTTERFLALFQLSGLQDLPRSEDPQ